MLDEGESGAPLDEGADGGGGGVEDGDLVVVDDFPEAVVFGPVGCALVHQDGGGAVEQRAVDDVAVAGDPADVGGAPEDVFLLEVEDVFAGEVGLDRVAAGGVEQALGLAGGAGGVEQEERVFGIHGLAGADLGSGELAAISSCQPEVAPSTIVGGHGRRGTFDRVRRWTRTCSMEGHLGAASSTMALSLTSVPRR